jgi:hypothetical protein
MGHYDDVIAALQDGELIPFLGAGVNLYGRDEADDYKLGSYLPSGRELAVYLANEFSYKHPDRNNLLLVSQYASTLRGSGSFYRRLGEVFDREYPINGLHKFLARVPASLKRRGCRHQYQLIVTTNYDDVLEEAFREEHEPFDLVTYVAAGKYQGKFRHVPHGALPREGTALIRLGEIKNAAGFIGKLRAMADPPSPYLRALLDPGVRRLLDAYDGSSEALGALLPVLVEGLNRALSGRLFDETHFAGVALAEDVRRLLDEKPQGGLATCINRLLLEESYPHELARSPRSFRIIEDPNTYRDLPFDYLKLRRTVILKIHGAVDRVADRESFPAELIEDSFVITEDDYITYLAHTDISKLVPAQLKSKLSNSGFLFLGYGLRDWNLRVIMHRMWGEQKLSFASWAIQRSAEDMEKELWAKRNVRIIETRLEEYIPELEQLLR